MCLTLYSDSDKARPVSNWNENEPRFYVEKLNAVNKPEQQFVAIEKVKPYFSKKFVYYAGSHECCGCGFRREGYIYLEEEELINTAENQKDLFEYVANRLKDENTLEIYACWSGNEGEPAKSSRKIAAEDSIKEDFFLAKMS